MKYKKLKTLMKVAIKSGRFFKVMAKRK